jgi:leucyl-tRNA synthetase
LVVIAPFAPHIAEELWHRSGFDGFVVNATWPDFKPQYLVASSVVYPIAFNGKTRYQIEVAADIDPKTLESLALSHEEAHKWLEGKAPKKVIVVPGRMVNVVV